MVQLNSVLDARFSRRGKANEHCEGFSGEEGSVPDQWCVSSLALSRRQLIVWHKDVPLAAAGCLDFRVKLSVPQIHDVRVTAQPHVITEVPANMIRVLIDHDLVTIPQPTVDKAVIVRSDAKVESVEPKTLSISSRKPEDMAAAEAAREASVFPRMILAVVGIISAGIMPEPPTSVVNVVTF
jgi:hypothetical protein